MSIEAIQTNVLGKATPFTTGSFKLGTIIKMLQILRESGRVKRTNLAGKVGLNYKQCVKYVNILFFLGWARFILDGGNAIVITEKGIEMIERLENF